MEKKVKVSFDEQSKCVTANVTIEYTEQGKDISDLVNKLSKEALEESIKLFESAQGFSRVKTLQKVN